MPVIEYLNILCHGDFVHCLDETDQRKLNGFAIRTPLGFQSPPLLVSSLLLCMFYYRPRSFYMVKSLLVYLDIRYRPVFRLVIKAYVRELLIEDVEAKFHLDVLIHRTKVRQSSIWCHHNWSASYEVIGRTKSCIYRLINPASLQSTYTFLQVRHDEACSREARMGTDITRIKKDCGSFDLELRRWVKARPGTLSMVWAWKLFSDRDAELLTRKFMQYLPLILVSSVW